MERFILTRETVAIVATNNTQITAISNRTRYFAIIYLEIRTNVDIHDDIC